MNTNTRTAAALGSLAALSLGAALLVPTSAQADPGTAVVARGGATARQAPSTFSATDTHFSGGSRVKVSCWLDGGAPGEAREQRWYKYDTEGSPSTWVPASELSRVAKSVLECRTEPVTSRTTAALTVRAGPSTKDAATTVRAKGSSLTLRCRLTSETVRNNDTWYLTDSGWVSARYVTGTTPQWCTRAR